MRKLSTAVIVITVLLLAAEVGVTLLSQRGIQRALRSQYGLPDSLEVGINSFPYLVSLARNHIGELQLAWGGELPYRAGEGAPDSIPYAGRVNLYDVELNMPALLRGRLEMRKVSRGKAVVRIEAADLNKALNLPEGTLAADADQVYLTEEGKKTRYTVKVSGENAVSLEPFPGYTDSEDSGEIPEAQVYTAVFPSLPMDAELLNAGIAGGEVVLEISIPAWEGYL